MAGNSKTKRKSANTRSTSKYKGAALPTLDLPPDASTLKQLAEMALVDFNAIIDGSGKMKNWMGVLYRLHVGYYAARNHFDYTTELHDCLYKGIVALRCSHIRAQLTGELGFLMWEFDAVKAALELTEELMRHLRLSESKAVHYEVDDYFKATVDSNTEQDPEARERKLMLATLEQERAAVAANEQLQDLEKVA